jgi:hypothetical protein
MDPVSGPISFGSYIRTQFSWEVYHDPILLKCIMIQFSWEVHHDPILLG